MNRETVWTNYLIFRLRTLWGQGLSISVIGERLGVSRNAVAGKRNRLKLPGRASPIRHEPIQYTDAELRARRLREVERHRATRAARTKAEKRADQAKDRARYNARKAKATAFTWPAGFTL